ncbi:helix-turn-helix domain-containing protein [Actinopolymorpha pittospori]|uniref:Excisionase family DNA binding protein n=1 Tax=Actinopolymorpha pittospori TaxID=648752 RepID=A0A927MSV6_9ACTN|nr:helix-turn-helix domain-containing protein [Actinopolymorpha pittospori]MBE1605549.1 excisionase family DNA binding protein [Actinopolymorpha pittospori]
MSELSEVNGPGNGSATGRPELRDRVRGLALQSALRKRAAGVPTYSVPEAAALLSVSQEHLYRLIRADAFPAVRMRLGADQGRYVVPAKAVERLLDAATGAGGCVEVGQWTPTWQDLPAGSSAFRGGDAA